jgi:hypothetical protein
MAYKGATLSLCNHKSIKQQPWSGSRADHMGINLVRSDGWAHDGLSDTVGLQLCMVFKPYNSDCEKKKEALATTFFFLL